jgi:hypothetical protein
MLRTLPALLNTFRSPTARPIQLRFFQRSPAAAMPCYSDDSMLPPEIRERMEKEKLKKERRQHEREILVCELGSLFARLKSAVPEVITKNLTASEQATIATLEAHHNEHRLEEHSILIEMTTQKIEEIQSRIAMLIIKRQDIKHNVKDKYEDLSAKEIGALISMKQKSIDGEIEILNKRKSDLEQKLSNLRNMDTTSDQFLIDRKYQDEIVTKLKR